jgi:hypothetical protein
MTATTQPKPSPAFFVQAGLSFGVALFAVCVGIVSLPVDRWMRGFLAIAVLYVVTSAFTLAKCIRDQQDAVAVTSRVDQARLDKMLAEHDPYATP